MSKLNKKQRWLSLAVAPLFSMTVMVGCSSDDDDDGDTTPEEMMEEEVVEVPSGEVPAAFLASTADGDGNSNGILDIYETPADTSATAVDSNENLVDDSFEAAITGGADENGDGIDDAALAALAGETPVVENPDTTEPVEQTGDLSPVTLTNSAGTGNLNWDGFTLTGTVDIADGVSASSATINSGIAAAPGNGQVIVGLNGSAPTFFVPTGMAQNIKDQISDGITRGNLFLNVVLSDGSSESGPIFLNGVQAGFAAMNSDNNVSGGDAQAMGSGFINLNTVTGDYTAAVQVFTFVSETDANGDPETVSAVHIHRGAADAEGGVIAALEPNDDASVWSITSTDPLSAADLELMINGETYFNAHRTDNSNFFRGQIPAF